MTLAATVREAAARFGDLAAFVAADGWALSYAELDRLSDEVARAFAEIGVGPGDLVALVLPSTPDYVVAYAAAAKLGAITAGINPRLTEHERDAVLAVARPRLVVTTDDLRPAAGAGLSRGPPVRARRRAGPDMLVIVPGRAPRRSSPPPATR